MKHQELFDITPFPIFTADKNGMILYKNKAAVRYIGTMRKGSHVMRYLIEEALPEAGELAHMASETPYPHALVLADEEKYLFLCPSRLQYPDFDAVAKQIITAFGRTPQTVFHRLEDGFIQRHDSKKIVPRIYTDILEFGTPPTLDENKTYLLGSLAEAIFKKAETRFLAFGYRIQTEISQDFAQNHPINTNLFGLLSLLGYLLYLTMKLSKDGKISLILTSKPETEMHLLRFDTHTAYHPQEKSTIFDIFTEITPECLPELIFIQETDPFSDNLTVHIDPLGRAILEYQIPYLAPTLTVHSFMSETRYELLFDRFFLQLCEMLKENFSSC